MAEGWKDIRVCRAVIDRLEFATRLVARLEEGAVRGLMDDKARIDALAEAARHSVLSRLELAHVGVTANFRLASDIIEQFKEIARLSRAAARSMQAFCEI